ncbi:MULTISPECIES: SDR family oxidoreductase [unclassified Tolypothrix]|uniref:SDR family oxidoreductase n=1 Tax=unclassified Tolypothrix TaxID=2649714 RepID=UPI0005EABD93|nr:MULTISPECIES: SDR family oxidoreductase [unclassified Tolypothrix]BAY88740.1 short-chain dehydrogenase/reductase SDR [Microchaete diplosiphon NIES-3275]EKF01622.1 oxidoreductase, short chain dehydrogenase/reductase family protein [Tolypothrix sp. PCC 7601]MBE9087710.1 SDR family oxidoreductase [Tolypothrix sp. LEGE 11397]UYD29401.1 SDR family oxidoreductase [Tolypothrix sp. PCC 7712]UYD34692.1 SDR family oxidoreductase [Tolypothrix sp. PCC 7601]
MQLKPISQQVVAIVGASSGIGRDTALKFAQRGAKVVVAARSEPGLKSLVEEIQSLGGVAKYVVADVSDFEQVKAIADQTVAEYGQLDTWVHAAATGVIAPFEKITPEEFARVVDVTLMGQVYGAMAALPHLKQTGRGALIHISSMEGRRSLPLQSPYSTAKHGLEGFLDALRVELQHEKWPISVTSILPATINTPFYNKVATKLGVKPTGVPPYYQPSLVADAILYAAEHPTRDFVVGDAGKILDFLQRISPPLADSLLLAIAFQGQRTNEPKSEDAPNNVFEPIAGYDKVEGDFRNLSIPSFLESLDMNPPLKWGALAFAALGIAALVGLWGRNDI